MMQRHRWFLPHVWITPSLGQGPDIYESWGDDVYRLVVTWPEEVPKLNYCLPVIEIHWSVIEGSLSQTVGQGPLGGLQANFRCVPIHHVHIILFI